MRSLQNVTVIDLSESIAGQFCSRMLADQGAEVILVEPVGGSGTRAAWPTTDDPDPQSFVFQNVNRGKRSVTLDQASAEGQAALGRLLDDADIVVAGPGFVVPPVPRSYALVTVSDFGVDGPLSGWSGNELVHQAMSGVMYETGKSSKRPLYGCDYRSYHAAGVAAYICAVTELFAHREGRARQDVEVEVAETAASMNYCRATQYDYSGIYDRRGGTKRPMAFVKCRDSWICLFPAGARWRPVCEVLGADDLLSDPDLQEPIDRIRRWRYIIDVFEEKVKDRDADEVVRAVQAVGGVASRAFTPLELLDSEQLRVRDFWRRTGNGRLSLGPMFRMSATPEPVHADAPERSMLDVAV